MIIRKLLETISQGVTIINSRDLLAKEYMKQGRKLIIKLLSRPANSWEKRFGN